MPKKTLSDLTSPMKNVEHIWLGIHSKFVASQLGKFIWQDEMVYRSVLSECSLGVLSVFSGCL